MLSCQRDDGVLAISGDLQVQHLADLVQALSACVDLPQDLVLDLTGVMAADLAGLQLLLAFLRSRPPQVSTRLSGLRPPLLNALELTGLDKHLAAYLA